MEFQVEKIRSVEPEELDDFLKYLGEQLREMSDAATPLFQPLSRIDLELPKNLRSSFENGLSIPVGHLNWRRAWIAVDPKSEILGHIDLRGHADRFVEHRALLGMGVTKKIRRRGLGRSLVETAVSWAKSETTIDWIDLWVLSRNKPAVALYNATGFQQLGKIEDMFRIDGESEDYTLMTRNLR